MSWKWAGWGWVCPCLFLKWRLVKWVNYLVVKGSSVIALKISSIGFFGCFFFADAVRFSFADTVRFFFVPSSFSFLFFFPPPPLVGRLFYVGSSVIDVKIISVSFLSCVKFLVLYIRRRRFFLFCWFFPPFFSPPPWSFILFRRFLHRHRSLFLYSAVSVS